MQNKVYILRLRLLWVQMLVVSNIFLKFWENHIIKIIWVTKKFYITSNSLGLQPEDMLHVICVFC